MSHVAWRRLPAGRGTDLGLKAAGVVAVLALAELCTRGGLLPERWFPHASDIYVEFFKLAGGRPLWVEIGRTLLGWAAGTASSAPRPSPAAQPSRVLPISTHNGRPPASLKNST